MPSKPEFEFDEIDGTSIISDPFALLSSPSGYQDEKCSLQENLNHPQKPVIALNLVEDVEDVSLSPSLMECKKDDVSSAEWNDNDDSARFSFMSCIDPSKDKQTDFDGPDKIYQWRKYGRKYNKKMGMFCSYFKCMTNYRCQAKKLVYHKEQKPGTSYSEDHHFEYYNEHNHIPPESIPKRGRKCKMALHVDEDQIERKDKCIVKLEEVSAEVSDEMEETSFDNPCSEIQVDVKDQNLLLNFASGGFFDGISPTTGVLIKLAGPSLNN